MTYKDRDELEEYCECSQDEFTDMVLSMLNLCEMSGLSDELEAVIERDLQLYLKDFRENYEVVERTETYTRTYRDLVRKDENQS